MRKRTRLSLLGIGLLAVSIALAQSSTEAPPRDLISKSIKAVSYQVGGGSTKIDLRSTSLAPYAAGEADIEANKGITKVEVEVSGLIEPTKLGAEFLTYVLWVVSPEGRFSNVGEIQLDNSRRGKLKATTPLQTFSLFVTAEPYFAVRQPCEMLVMENGLRKGT